jgi:uroporphyrin-III C-methyltransferase/precorrin-2 dehydrogenase/sirohydrochlorin ferrochelatase
VACAAYAGIPLTHRNHAQSLRLLTAHAQDGDGHPGLGRAGPQPADAGVLHGRVRLARLRDNLLASGRDPTRRSPGRKRLAPEQRVITGTLDELPESARRHAVQAPALLMIGEVAALATQLHWFGARP